MLRKILRIPKYWKCLSFNALKIFSLCLKKTDYIIKTTHPKNESLKNLEQFRKEIEDFSNNTKFLNLEILDFKEYGNSAVVSFIATLESNNKDISFSEVSEFENIDGIWFYKGAKEIKKKDQNF